MLMTPFSPYNHDTILSLLGEYKSAEAKKGPALKIWSTVAFAMRLRQLNNVQWVRKTTEYFLQTKEI